KVLEAKTAELTALEKQRAELGDKLKTIGVLEQKRVGPAQVLANLSDATPEADHEGTALKKFVVQARLSYSGEALPPATPDLKFPEPPRGVPGPAKPAGKGNRA